MEVSYFLSQEFNDKYNYKGKLGVIYSKNSSVFKIWAPTADDVEIILYGKNYKNINENPKKIKMKKEEKGLWKAEINGDLNGEYYNFLVTVDNKTREVVDPYAKAVSINGEKSMVIDLDKTNPEGWDKDKKPKLLNPTDSIIYEIHVRDFTIDYDSGVSFENRGKYLGFVEQNDKIKATNISTGLDHLIELGITHVHLLPVFDYGSIDERCNDCYNWGYDPQNYNVPEGSYCSDPYDPVKRIREFKEMVYKLHEAGIRVVMDMVYNHTYSLDSPLNKAVPGYYYRQNENGDYSDGSGCGNETASDRYMFRKYMIDSILYWTKEYHIDGFRFDLMGLHDIETMKCIRNELDKIDPSILMYGEGWTCNVSPLAEEEACLKKNTYKYGELQIAAFSDDARDGVKGKVFYQDSLGFVNGGNNLEESIKYIVTAATKHNEIDLTKCMYSNEFWANEPYQTITYDSAHDNNTLFDKLRISCRNASDSELVRMNKLVAAIVLTSQGITFLHAGEEFARIKENELGEIVENSYNSSDFVNKIKWIRKRRYYDLFEYYKGLIELRKKYKAFRMNKNSEIQKNIKFMKKDINFNKDNIVGYFINSEQYNDDSNKIAVIFNGNDYEVEIDLKDTDWNILVNDQHAGAEAIGKVKGNLIKMPRKCAYVLIK